MNKKKYNAFLKITILSIMIILFIQIVQAQTNDSDGDGVQDYQDACLNTNNTEIMPLSTNDPDYIGCSCDQIIQKLENENCYDVFCVSGKPLSINERIYSSEKEYCPQDYCIGSTQYDYPEPQYPVCRDGKPQDILCEPTLRRNSAPCVTGELLQYDELQRQQEQEEQTQEKITKEKQQPILKDQVYSILQESLLLKNKLDITTRQNFEDKIISDNILTEQQTTIPITISGATTNITENIIKIKPRQGTTISGAIILERINLPEGITKQDYIFQQKPEQLSEDPWIVYWKLGDVKQETNITYRIRKQTQTQEDIMLLGAVKNPNVFWQILPIILIIFVIIMTYIWFKNNLSKRKIFK